MKNSGARFSRDKKYRYVLWRIWDSDLPMVNIIGLNPSTADETENDNTMRRCISFSKEWGFGGFYMTNLFALRTPYPSELIKNENPIGPQNNRWIKNIYEKVDTIVLAWGVQGKFMNRDRYVYKKVNSKAFCLGYTKDGFPKHPLYVKAGTKLKRYEIKD